ncbi:MAG: hypothetical protein II544_03920 [Spirochaetales bacterium]|nr:hypothetical protein [Spirochaetales bacterium]
MATFEDIRKVNAEIKMTDIGRGKEYAEVPQRVTAFRKLYPNGSLTSELVLYENGVFIVKATATDEDGRILGTGLAYEKEGSSFINKTSALENAETSAWGRCLAACGLIGGDSICSAEEVQNAILNQEGNETISDKDAAKMKKLLQETDSDVVAFLKMVNDKFGRGITSVDEMNRREHGFASVMLNKKIAKQKGDSK